MDSWSNEQVEGMKRNGNLSSNRAYNPQNVKPSIPLDVDEVDSAMERFIRQKYEHRSFSGGTARPTVRQNTGSTRSSEEQPPPLPPKPGKRFGFGLRAASSTFPLSRTARESPPESPDGRTGFGGPPSPIHVNKQSRVFGASIGGTGATFDSKLETLRDMGFADEKRNSAVLKGLSGNLERAVETLVRLGEGNAPSSRARSPMPPRSMSNNGWAADQPPKAASPIKSSNPFDQPTADPPTQNQRIAPEHVHSNGGYFSNSQGQSNSYNPFDAAIQNPSSSQTLEQTFQNLQVSQPLFPNATGGYPSQQQQLQQARYQQSMTPPVPQIPQQYTFSSYTQQQQQQPPLGNYNPFFQTPQQPLSNPYISPQQLRASANPYAVQSYNTASFIQNQPLQPPQQQPQHQQQFPSYTQQHPALETPQQSHQYRQPLLPQQTGRIDKTSILALYNYPHLAPTPFHHLDTTPTPSSNPPLPNLPPGLPSHGQRSVTMPATLSSGSRNPFLPVGGGAVTDAGGGGGGGGRPTALQANGNGNGESSRHVSQESVDVGGLQSGRHSPDAFASLSARFVR
ncbi:MAG: hypothetical protein M1830_004395 [Pleopsidium flavum]|nr:MAG: hypothetical protein M1830_004395 [Pleopsidium flavum]